MSVTSANPRSANGVAMLSRADGKTLFVANYISSELKVIDLARLKEATNPLPK